MRFAKTLRSRFDALWRQPNPSVALLALWVLFIIYATTLPFKFSESGETVRARVRRIWENPIQWRGMRADAVSNVLLFMPFGFLLASGRAEGGARFGSTVFVAAGGGALLSGSVELAQLFSPTRVASVLDVITNTLGATTGAMIGWVATRRLWPVASILIHRLLAARPVTACAVATAVVLVIAGISPADRARNRSDLIVGKTRKGRPIRFRPSSAIPEASITLLDWSKISLRWILPGGLFLLAAWESGWRGNRAVGAAVAAAASLLVLIDALRVIVPNRNVSALSDALALLGSATGAAAVARSTAGEPRRAIPLAILFWCLAVVLSAWSPWKFEWPTPPYLTKERFVPFWSYFYSRSLADLREVVTQILTFAPLGALLAARSPSQSLIGATFAGLGLSFVLEVGQVFLPNRLADISDVISAAVGAGFGLMIWRWGERARTPGPRLMRSRIHPYTDLSLEPP